MSAKQSLPTCVPLPTRCELVLVLRRSARLKRLCKPMARKSQQIGRATVVPLPSELQTRLGVPLANVSEAIATHMRSTADALRTGAGTPALGAVEAALQAYGEEVAALRSEGLTRGLPGDVIERFFALGFCLEQMRQNLKDLE